TISSGAAGDSDGDVATSSSLSSHTIPKSINLLTTEHHHQQQQQQQQQQDQVLTLHNAAQLISDNKHLR
ncbi:MAG: hypothetical protein N6V41_01735, partial [Candidatus Portiera aleyrodidarum]|nr:hypothetical protein [Candidatus Portiera aleyrodidarum]